MPKGMTVQVYRNACGWECTNGGPSSRFHTFCLTGPGVPQLFEPSADVPELVLVIDQCCGVERQRAIPREMLDADLWTMFGGNFVYSSDSRFPSRAPIKVHDRVEP